MLGSGAFGVVYQCKDQQNKKFAIKILNIQKQNINQIEEEIQLQQQLDHQNVIKLYGTQKTPNQYYLLLELADDDLNKYIQRNLQNPQTKQLYLQNVNNPMSFKFRSDQMKRMLQICFGLQHLHSNNIAHRDLKPVNILIANGTTMKIGDLGISRLQENSFIQTDNLAGTIPYMSPEVLKMNDDFNNGLKDSSQYFVNIQSFYPWDIWSLGCILIELITLQHPFKKNGQFARNLALEGNYNFELINDPLIRNLAKKMLEVKTKKRIQIDQVIKEIEQMINYWEPEPIQKALEQQNSEKVKLQQINQEQGGVLQQQVDNQQLRSQITQLKNKLVILNQSSKEKVLHQKKEQQRLKMENLELQNQLTIVTQQSKGKVLHHKKEQQRLKQDIMQLQNQLVFERKQSQVKMTQQNVHLQKQLALVKKESQQQISQQKAKNQKLVQQKVFEYEQKIKVLQRNFKKKLQKRQKTIEFPQDPQTNLLGVQQTLPQNLIRLHQNPSNLLGQLQNPPHLLKLPQNQSNVIGQLQNPLNLIGQSQNPQHVIEQPNYMPQYRKQLSPQNFLQKQQQPPFMLSKDQQYKKDAQVQKGTQYQYKSKKQKPFMLSKQAQYIHKKVESFQTSQSYQNQPPLNGFGKIVDSDGGEYEGQFKNGKPNGQGTAKYPNGDIFQGQFKQGKRHGKGKSYYTNGEIYEGDYVNDKKHGKGIFYCNDRGRYEGDYANGQKHGKGIYCYNNGDRYEGDYVNGKKHGKGIYYYNNSDKYQGDFANDEIHGKGTFYYADGRINTGYWKYGTHQGN